jgi:hypothetical protein
MRDEVSMSTIVICLESRLLIVGIFTHRISRYLHFKPESTLPDKYMPSRMIIAKVIGRM